MKLTVIALLAASAVLPLACPSCLLAGTYRVSASGSNTPPYDTWEKASHTIQVAIDSCVNGDTVLVGPGTYSPASGEQFPVHIIHAGVEEKGGLTICGVSGRSTTIVDAQGTGAVFRLEYVSLGITGLTIKGGFGRGIDLFGSGAYVADCVISDNQGAAVGGFVTGPGITVRNSVISRNGGGVFSEDGHGATIDSSTVSDNRGHGVWSYGLTTVKDSEVTGNDGVGAHSWKGRLSITRANVSHNRSGGATAYLTGISMHECIVLGNGGDGIRVDQGSIYMEGSLVADNAGHGVLLSDSGMFPKGDVLAYDFPDDVSGGFPQILGCTIYGNTGSGIALYGVAGLFPQIGHTIISGNTGPSLIRTSPLGTCPSFTCCDVFGNEGGDWVGCIAEQEGVNGNFCLDPLFCGSEVSDFRLSSASPCANGLGCGQIGAFGMGCGPTAIEYTTWGQIKTRFR